MGGAIPEFEIAIHKNHLRCIYVSVKMIRAAMLCQEYEYEYELFMITVRLVCVCSIQFYILKSHIAMLGWHGDQMCNMACFVQMYCVKCKLKFIYLLLIGQYDLLIGQNVREGSIFYFFTVLTNNRILMKQITNAYLEANGMNKANIRMYHASPKNYTWFLHENS